MTRPRGLPSSLITGTNKKVLLLTLFAAIAITALNESYYMDVVISIGIIFIFIIALDLVIGYAGQLSLGHTGFFAIGAYSSAILTLRLDISPLLALSVGAVTNGLAAFALGLVVFRARELYFAIMTLAFGIIVSTLTVAFYDITEGTMGLSGIRPLSFGVFSADPGIPGAILVWVVVIAVFWFSSNLVNARVGRALRSIHADEPAAEAIGVDVMKYKLKVFVVSAVIASVAGSIYVHYRGAIAPGMVGTILLVESLLMLFLGGVGTLWGGLVGVSLLKVLPQFSQSLEDYKALVYALVFILILFFLPKGLAGAAPQLGKKLGGTIFSTRFRLQRMGIHSHAGSNLAVPLSHQPCLREGLGSSQVLEVSEVSRFFGGLQAVADLSFTLSLGTVQSLIGPNGAGKSTTLNLINGVFALHGGHIRFAGQLINGLKPNEVASLGIGRTFQVPRLFGNMTVLENVMMGYHIRTRAEMFQAAFSLPLARREEAFAREEGFRLLCEVGLSGEASEHPTSLSHGQKRWVELARVLASQPKLLLLDEPTSGLNDAEKDRFREFLLLLKAKGITTLLVEHDMNFVMGISDHIVVMNYGKKLAEGCPEEIQQNEDVIRAYLG